MPVPKASLRTQMICLEHSWDAWYSMAGTKVAGKPAMPRIRSLPGEHRELLALNWEKAMINTLLKETKSLGN